LISDSDLVCLPYTPDLTEGGISYACRSLPHTYDRMGGNAFDRLRRIVTGIAVELAFRRHLTQQGIPFDVRGATPFTDPDRYDVSLGGHRCDIKSFLLLHREQITSLHANPALLLNAPGLVPLDQYAGENHSANDLYLFAFLTGLVAATAAETRKAREAGKPIHLVHPMPSGWVRPQAWVPLGPLSLKSEAGEPLTVEVGGQDAGREFITRRLALPPRTRLDVEGDFHSLAYVHVSAPPQGRLGIYSPARRETYLVQPEEWGNIWVYGMRIYLAGWIGREEFRQKAGLLYEGSRVFQYDRTRVRNLAVSVSELQPLAALLARVGAWSQARSNAAE
jgi:hypothetical protein